MALDTLRNLSSSLQMQPEWDEASLAAVSGTYQLTQVQEQMAYLKHELEAAAVMARLNANIKGSDNEIVIFS